MTRPLTNQMSDSRYLLIVEGEKAEVKVISSVFQRYGFKTLITPKIRFDSIEDFKIDQLRDETGKTIYIAQSAQSRIHDIVAKFNKNTDSIERFFHLNQFDFRGIFLLFDVDHNDKEDLSAMFRQFDDESEGLLLISSPCFEVLADEEAIPGTEKAFHSFTKEYKAPLNRHHQDAHGCNSMEYIQRNFEPLALRFLDYNQREFNSNNVMEHPSLVIDKINELNERRNWIEDGNNLSECIYRYYTTVIYVLLAFVFGLTVEIDNCSKVRDFLAKYSD